MDMKNKIMTCHYINMNEISIVITDDRIGKYIRRTCIVPIDWDKEKLVCYLSLSLKISKSLISILEIQEVWVFYESIEKIDSVKLYNNEILDYYWQDVKEFIVEIEKDDKIIDATVISNYDEEEETIKKKILEFFPSSIVKVDYYRDCWLSR